MLLFVGMCVCMYVIVYLGIISNVSTRDKYTHACLCVCVCVCMCVYIYIYIYIYIYKYAEPNNMCIMQISNGMKQFIENVDV